MKSRSFVVGLFVTVALALFAAGLFLIGSRHEVFAHHIEYYAEFKDLSGLMKGGKVQVAGMDAGQVLDIGVPATPASRFRVHIRINDNLRGLVRTDSVATIGTEGVVGDTFLLIHPGSPHAAAASAGATLPSKEPTELSDLLDQGKGLLTNVDITVRNANGLLTSVGGNLNATLNGAQTAIGNVNDVVVGLKQGKGPAGMLLHDDAVSAQIRQTLTNAQQATDNLNQASLQANHLVTDIQARHLPQKVDDSLVSVKSAAANIDATSGQLRQTLAEATGPDEQGLTAGANLRESLTNVDAATSNMADETEALKHGFFFRGFFRHRGYFNLQNISAAKYRNDRLFTNPQNARSWLPADQLFERESNGVEHLTAQGRTLLDSAVAAQGDSIAASPIVIEGYFEGPNAAEQIARSRSRALAVRSYLQNHFQLDASHLGVVAMKSTPPSGFDHATWDGVCVVIVTPKA
jgi:phospholipid/cholesterol/gamma-HCH transport system substrate-binding protein